MTWRIARIAGAICAIATLPATAAGYPEKPIRILTPFSAGSVTDLLARPLAARLSEAWGQPVVVDNRTGAGGSIAAEIVARATPDGYTLLVGAAGPTVINPLLVKNLAYDAQRAFTPITLTATNNLLLTVTPSLPAKSVRELLELARAKPGQLRFGSPGIGSSPHLAGELLKAMAGIDMVHVAYKGSPQYTVDLLAGRIDLVFAAAGALLPHIKSGRLRLLAVGNASRDPAMPDVPAVSETVPGFEVVGWFGLLTTAGTPAPVIKKLYTELVRILAEPDVKNLYANAGLETTVSASPAEFAALIRSEREKWAKIIKAVNLRVE
ncbi:MAG: tripartite tricarboxylate transporter substrate binding protein [Betaproteobacteria bacterium]